MVRIDAAPYQVLFGFPLFFGTDPVFPVERLYDSSTRKTELGRSQLFRFFQNIGSKSPCI